MKKWLISPRGKFYKANLHTHTNISDGKFSPEEIKELYQKEGYSVVAFTDHDIFVCHNDLSDENFIALNSHELEIHEAPAPSVFKKTYHLNFYAKHQDTRLSPVFSISRVWGNGCAYVTEEMKQIDERAVYDTESINRLIRIANENDFFVMYNHPVWSLQTYPDYIGLKGLWAIEIWNYGCVYDALYDNAGPYDDLLRAGTDLLPTCTDDTHTEVDMFGGWVQIKTTDFSYDGIINALLKGDFYASTGAQIKSLYIEDGLLHVKTSPAVRIDIITDWRGNKCFRPEPGKRSISEAVYPMENLMKKYNSDWYDHENSYFRVEVTTKDGKKAYSRAFRLRDL